MKKEIQSTLRNVFGLQDFREGQKEIIECILEEKNALIFMPTGGGKSLTYQLPGVLREGLTIVISPLISLMKDQVDSLNEIGLEAAFINSTQEGSERKKIYKKISDGSLNFLYIAPERLASKEFMDVIGGSKIALLAIDEAHCISQWGHDFRPSYMKIKGFIENLAARSFSSKGEGWDEGVVSENQSFPVIALTATATKKVREDIVERLGISEYETFISGFDRKNIHIIVRELSLKEEKQEKVCEILEKTPGVGIVYCSSRKHVVELHKYLSEKGVLAGIYKGDLSPEKREQEQDKFMNDEYKVMIATNAFGMGIDKKDIRFVIHYNLPGSIENYYQEIGRAGRDGKKSFAVVLASYGDTKIQEFFIENTYPSRQEVLDLYDYLYKDIKLSEGIGTQIEKTYASLASLSGIGNDMRVASIIKILEKYGILERGLGTQSDDFRGRGITLKQEKRKHAHILINWKRQDMLEKEAYYKLEQIKQLLFYPSCRKKFILEYFGDEEDLKKLGDNCKACDYCLELKQYSHSDIEKLVPSSSYAIILETVKKYDEKFGQATIANVLVGSHEKKILDWGLDHYEHHGALGEYSLKTILGLIDVLMMEDFIYKTDGRYPVLGITELGTAAVRKTKYITDRLTELNGYILQKVGKELTKKQSNKNTQTSGKKRKGETYNDTLKLFREGKDMKAIAQERGLSPQTIEGHIVTLYEKGDITLLDIMKCVNFDHLKIIKDIKTHNTESLKEIKETLEENGYMSISYFEIKIARAMIEKGDL